MKLSALTLGALFVLTGCASSRPVAFTAPAPYGSAEALECALAKATEDYGYRPARGGIADGYLYLVRPRDYTGGEAAKEATTRVLTMGMAGDNRARANILTVTGANGTLRIEAASEYDDGKVGKPAEDAELEAQQIMALCTSEPEAGSSP